MRVSADEGRNLQKPLTAIRTDDDMLMTLSKKALVLTVDH